jgi:hypothetical protein
MALHCKENPIYVFIFWELRGLSPNFHIHVSVIDLYIPRIGPHISCIINLSQIYECRNRETEHHYSVLKTTVGFLGIHKWEPDIYIGSHQPFICRVSAFSWLSPFNHFLPVLSFEVHSILYHLKKTRWFGKLLNRKINPYKCSSSSNCLKIYECLCISRRQYLHTVLTDRRKIHRQ